MYWKAFESGRRSCRRLPAKSHDEGLIGISLFMGGETTPSRAIVQSAGYAYRLIG